MACTRPTRSTISETTSMASEPSRTFSRSTARPDSTRVLSWQETFHTASRGSESLRPVPQIFKENNVFRRLTFVILMAAFTALAQNKVPSDKEVGMKADLAGQIDGMKKQAQVMVDSVFSFGELGFQEFETSKYLTGILEKEGFKIERGVAGIPTAWVATWGSGKPVISLGSDIDDIPQASQKPGVGWHEPIVEGAPGHGEGHNSGVPMNILAAIAVKKVMEREHIPGTLHLWPGIAEELLGGKAY